jgi:hypothetical protein
MYFTMIESPIGDLLVGGNGAAIALLYVEVRRWGPEDTKGWQRDDARAGRGQRAQSHLDHDPVSSRRGRERIPYGVRRRAGTQALAPGA